MLITSITPFFRSFCLIASYVFYNVYLFFSSFDGVTTMILTNKAIGDLPSDYGNYFGPWCVSPLFIFSPPFSLYNHNIFVCHQVGKCMSCGCGVFLMEIEVV